MINDLYRLVQRIQYIGLQPFALLKSANSNDPRSEVVIGGYDPSSNCLTYVIILKTNAGEAVSFKGEPVLGVIRLYID